MNPESHSLAGWRNGDLSRGRRRTWPGGPHARARDAWGSRGSGTPSRAYREPVREPPGALSAARVASRETASRASDCQRRDAVAKLWQRERLITQTRRIRSASSVSPRSRARAANASASATGAKRAAAPAAGLRNRQREADEAHKPSASWVVTLSGYGAGESSSTSAIGLGAAAWRGEMKPPDTIAS